MIYYEHHLGDYAEATSHLSFVEDAAYSKMLRKVYSTEQALPADLGAVQRLVGARTKEEKTAVETVLSEFFTLKEDGWHNERADKELAKYRDKRTKASASANARWSSQNQHSERNAKVMRTHSEGNANGMLSNPQSPIPNKNPLPLFDEPANGKHAAIPGDVEQVFDHWRSVWDKPRAKLDPKRERTIRAALKLFPLDQVCRSLTGYGRSPFHRGQNDRNTVFDEITLHLRDTAHIEAGLGHAEKEEEKQWT